MRQEPHLADTTYDGQLAQRAAVRIKLRQDAAGGLVPDPAADPALAQKAQAEGPDIPVEQGAAGGLKLGTAPGATDAMAGATGQRVTSPGLGADASTSDLVRSAGPRAQAPTTPASVIEDTVRPAVAAAGGAVIEGTKPSPEMDTADLPGMLQALPQPVQDALANAARVLGLTDEGVTGVSWLDGAIKAVNMLPAAARNTVFAAAGGDANATAAATEIIAGILLPPGGALKLGKAAQALGLGTRAGLPALKDPAALGQIAEDIARVTQEAGGASYNLAQGKNLAKTPGFAVAIKPEAGVILDRPATAQDISEFIAKNQDALDNKAANVGTWFDASTGKTHLDISVVTETRDQALQLGQEYRQLAVFDLERMEDIRVIPNTVGHAYTAPAAPLRPADVAMATMYDAAPMIDDAARPSWAALSTETDRMYDDVLKKVKVERVSGQPYASAEEMNADIARGVFKVTTDNSDHPLWSVDQNWKFRVVHDYYGHFLQGNDFSLDGEYRAWQAHARLLGNPLAAPALQVEVYGQAAAAIAHSGEFQPQKVFLPKAFEKPTAASEFERRLLEPATKLGMGATVDLAAPAAVGAAATVASAMDQPAEGGPVQAGIPANLPLLFGAGALAGVKKGNKTWNALASRGAAMIYRGANSEKKFTDALVKEYGQDAAAHAPGLWVDAQDQFAKHLQGLPLTKTKQLLAWFETGDQYPDWYGTRQELIELFGPDARTVSKFLAANSAHTAVEPNVAYALNHYLQLKTGEAIAPHAGIKNAAGKFTLPPEMDTHAPNVRRAAEGAELRGNKVNSFDHNIWGDERRVTVDGQMARIVFGGENVGDLTDAKYAAAERVIQDFADNVGVTPRYAQQALWVGRKLAEDNDFVVPTLLDTVKEQIDRVPGLADLVRKNKLPDEFTTAAVLGQLITSAAAAGAAAMDTSEETAGEALAGMGLGGLGNPRAAKALAVAARLLRRKTPAFQVEAASVGMADRFKALDPTSITVGDKLLSLKWEDMHGNADAIRDTVQKLKELYDVEGVNVAGRGVVKDVDEALLAAHLRELGFDADAVLARRPGEALNSTEVWAAADVTKAAVLRLNQFSAELDGMAAGQPLLRNPAYALTEESWRMQAGVAGALIRQMRGAGEEAGRALRAFQVAGRELGLSGPQQDFLMQTAEMSEKGLIANPQKLRELWNALPKTNQKVKLLDTIAKHGYDLVVEAFYDSILSGTATNIANIISGSAMTAYGPITRYVAGALTGNAAEYQAGTAMIHGMWAAMGEALINAKDGFLTGKSKFGGGKTPAPAMSGERFAETLHTAGIGLAAPLAKALDAIGLIAGAAGPRALMSFDEFVKTVNFRASLYEQATYAAAQQALKGQERADFFVKYVTDAPDHAVQQAKAYAHHVTFTTPLEGDLAAASRLTRNPVVLPFVPFFRVAANIAKFNFEHIPGLAYAVGRARADWAAGGPAQDVVAAKLAIGTVAMGFGVWLAMNGKVTGRGPSDPEAKKRMQEVGWQPYAAVFTDDAGRKSYVSLNRLDPFAAPFLLAANYIDIYQEMHGNAPLLSWDGLEEIGAALVLTGYDHWTNRSWMSGFREMTEALTAKDAKALERVGKSLRRPAASMVTPNLAAGVERQIDPAWKETYDFVDEVYSRIPWAQKREDGAKTLWGHTVYPRRRLDGKPLIRNEGLGPDFASPLPYSNRRPDPVSSELIRHEVDVPDLPKSVGTGVASGDIGEPSRISKIKLTPAQYDKWARLAGNELKIDTQETFYRKLKAFGWTGDKADLPEKAGMWDFLTEFVQTPKFKAMTNGPDGGKAYALRSIISGYRQAAFGVLQKEDEKLMGAVVENQLQHVEALAGPEAREQAEPLVRAGMVNMFRNNLVESLGR
jgi:hypothetical protein